MNRFLPLILSVVFWGSLQVKGAWRREHHLPLTIVNELCACPEAGLSEYESPAKFAFGDNRGKCIDSCRFRAIESLDESDGRRLIANILHEGKYWIASVPMNSVDRVSIGFEAFRPRINHVYLRFSFSNAEMVKLYPNLATARSKTRPRYELRDLILSAEGVPAQGLPYSVSSSAFGNYLLIHRWISLTGFADYTVGRLNHSIQQYQLHLSGPERAQALDRALQASVKNGFSSIYNLLFNNCATAAIRAVVDQDFQWRDFDSGLSVDLSIGTFMYLRRRGLLAEGKSFQLPNLEEEYFRMKPRRSIQLSETESVW